MITATTLPKKISPVEPFSLPSQQSTSTQPTAVAPPPNTYSESNGHEDLNSEDLNSEEIAWLNVVEHDDLAKCLNACVDRWRNAGPEARKKMFALFAIAGIFLAVCRHGHVLVICDMIRSGELCVTSFVMFIVSLTLTF